MSDTLTPPPAPPPPASPRRRPVSFWLALILAFLLLGSLFLNGVLTLVAAGAGAGAGSGSGTGRYEEILVDGERSAREKIVVLPINGVIMQEDEGLGERHVVSDVRTVLRALREDDSVNALVLEIDSPGGGITASDQIYHELKVFREETGIPIVSLFGDVAASGGYYVAMASDHIVAHSTSITGSIGVISQFPVVRVLMNKVGVQINTIKSLNDEGGTSFKDMGSPFREMTAKERGLLQSLITEMWNRFVTVVAEGRKGKLDLNQVKSLADGRVFSGEKARELKLVDQVGYQDASFAKARELGKSPKAKVVRLRRRPDLFGLLSSLEARGSGLAGADLLHTLEQVGRSGPRLLYLWSGS